VDAFLIEDVQKVQEIDDLHFASPLFVHLVLFKRRHHKKLKCFQTLNWIRRLFFLFFVLLHRLFLLIIATFFLDRSDFLITLFIIFIIF
jgi:hypothetical protein